MDSFTLRDDGRGGQAASIAIFPFCDAEIQHIFPDDGRHMTSILPQFEWHPSSGGMQGISKPKHGIQATLDCTIIALQKSPIPFVA
jgi:hypothetical protein